MDFFGDMCELKTTFKMVETLSLKKAFPFKIAQKTKKEVRNFASDPHPPFKVVAWPTQYHARRLATLRWARGWKIGKHLKIWKLPKKG